jgi:hypothetical protein
MSEIKRSEIKRLKREMEAHRVKAECDLEDTIEDARAEIKKQEEAGITAANAVEFLRIMKKLYNEATEAGAALAEIDGEDAFSVNDDHCDISEHIARLVSVADL